MPKRIERRVDYCKIPFRGEIQEKLQELITIPRLKDNYERLCYDFKCSSKDKVRISYRWLPELLNALEISLFELYEKIGVDADIRSEEDKEFFKLCSVIPEKDLSELTNYIKDGRLFTTWWNDADIIRIDYSPVERFRGVLREKYSSLDRKKDSIIYNGTLSEELVAIYKQSGRAIPIEAIPQTAKILDISLRWLLCIDEKYPIFSNNSTTDTLFDLYKLLPDDRKSVIWGYLNKKYKKLNQ